MAGKHHDTDEPEWRIRIRRATEPHGQLAAIAKAAGMTSPQLQKIANGTTKDPGLSTMSRIAHAMGLTLSALVSPRPEDGAGRAAEQRREGSPVLQGAVDDAAAETSLREDVERAIEILRAGLDRQHDRSPSRRETQEPGRRAAPDR